jgi:nicotinate-nucleotide adenylyltransferase
MKTDWSDTTAIFGGTFDPPHVGHREAVIGLFLRPGVRDVRVIPSAKPPHKPTVASAGQRLEMARLCFRALPGFPFPADVLVDPREIQRGSSGKPTYSYDTLQDLGREIPFSRLAFVLGTDQLRDLPKWHRFPEILGLCHWIVLQRKLGNPIENETAVASLLSSGLARPTSASNEWVLPGQKALRLVTTDAPEISSSQIRETIARTGNAPEEQVLMPVAAYLKTHRIYGTERELK